MNFRHLLGCDTVVMIVIIDLSQEILAMDILRAFEIVFEASSQACSATLTTISIPGLSLTLSVKNLNIGMFIIMDVRERNFSIQRKNFSFTKSKIDEEELLLMIV